MNSSLHRFGWKVLPVGKVIARKISLHSAFLSLSGGRMPEATQKLVTVEDNLTDDEAGLVAPEKEGFRVREDSPAWKLGFQAIPFEKIGVYKDGCR